MESTLVEEDPHMTLMETADAVGILTGTAQAIVMSIVDKFCHIVIPNLSSVIL